MGKTLERQTPKSAEQTPSPVESDAMDLKQVVREKLERIQAEREKIRGSVAQIERELDELQAVLQKAKPGGEQPRAAAPSTGEPVSPDQAKPGEADLERVNALADRSKWSPKLRKFVEEHWPEEGKEERIRRANERPLTTLGYDLPMEVVRYYAEDVDFEYDV